MTPLGPLCGHLCACPLTLFAAALCTGVATAQQAVPDAAQARPTPNAPTQLPAGAVLRVGQGHVGQVAGLALLGNGATLLTSAKDDTLRLWERASGNPAGRLVVPRSRPKSMAVTADGKLLAVLAPDGKLQLLALPDGRLRKEWQAGTAKHGG